MRMTERQAKRIFDRYNPANGVVRCPNGRAKMRRPLEIYAKAAVNLYGIIGREEFVELFNAHHDDQTSTAEVYALLLPNVLKHGWYGFYKDYIVHYAILRNFDWVGYLESHQAGKPRYVPSPEQFGDFEYEGYQDNDRWYEVCRFMLRAFGYEANTSRAFQEIQGSLSHGGGLGQLGPIMDEYGLVPSTQDELQEFLDLITTAVNNTRLWENKGYTPEELMLLMRSQVSDEIVMSVPVEVSSDDCCPCGSGKAYATCCELIERSGAAQIAPAERRRFYELWYRLLAFVNQKYRVSPAPINPVYPSTQDELELRKISTQLWDHPETIGEFLASAHDLLDDDANLLRSWQTHHRRGRFVLMEYTPEHALLMSDGQDQEPEVYAVKGMTASIAQVMRRPLPVVLDTVLLPFGDCIIYDSHMESLLLSFGAGFRRVVEEEYAQAKSRHGIVTRLPATEPITLPGGG